LENGAYRLDLESYLPRERFERIRDFASSKETPLLVLDLPRFLRRYEEIRSRFSFAETYYAVKANPDGRILRALADRGSRFDVASIHELDQLIALGVEPERISYGNTIKKARDIAHAWRRGVRVFATDSESDVRKLAENAPGSRVFFRILADCSGADWPLSRKFGTHPDSIYRLVGLARNLGLEPFGLSFHVGSQQRQIGQWDFLISVCRYLFSAVEELGVRLRMINLGGGLPARYLSPTHDLSVYAGEIRRYLEEDFGDGMPQIWIEPGRGLAGDAGILVSEVVLISRKSQIDQCRWVYLDAGRFNGLIETLDEAIKYPIYTEREGAAQKVILAGPTCDSMDVMYETHKYELPLSLQEGDRLYFLSAGAYTASYASVNFNGFPPIRQYLYDEPEGVS
jgi:ornithine decarboxylase